MRCLASVAVLLVLAASPALAGVSPRPGANHRLGDDSFVVRFGRAPDAADPEPLRMRVHLEHVRGWLAARPATRPELAGRRAELLGYLGEYIAKGTTPSNTYVARRSPVFIDARGNICAVGYLIERSVGRALPEQIAAAHRTSYLEDIAAAMPAVRAWAEASGLSLDELASIQPAYSEPAANEWRTWDLVKYPQPDGPYDGFGTGTFRRGQMEGEWRVVNEGGVVVGKGTMRGGAGTWTSFYPGGKPRAIGPYVANRAHGAWKLFHPSGHLAAEGAFTAGRRHGEWTFYHDTPARTPIARGRFDAGGHAIGTWKHFDPAGALYATSFPQTPTPELWGDRDWNTNGGEGFVLDLARARGGVKHRIHQGTVGQQRQRLDMLSLGDDRLYVQYSGQDKTIYDPDGWKLERMARGKGWRASDCRWGKTRKRVARSGDVTYLHGLLYKELRDRHLVSPDEFGDDLYGKQPRPIVCRPPIAVPAARARRIEALLAGAERPGVASPAFVRAAALDGYERTDPAEPTEWELEREAAAASFTRVLVDGMAAWREWPHVDRLFVGAFATMPGRFRKHWVDPDPQEPEAPAAADPA
jgi:hypothetical protein